MAESFDLRQNHFELFSLPVAFEIDGAAMTARYRDLQKRFHPDNFASGTPQEKRYSAQISALVNEAYKTLGDDLQRASYLLSLQGIDLASETDTRVAPEFLMAQMELRETLEAIPAAADPFAEADVLDARIAEQRQAIKARVAEQLSAQNFDAARESVREWQFFHKLASELDGIVHALEETQDS